MWEDAFFAGWSGLACTAVVGRVRFRGYGRAALDAGQRHHVGGRSPRRRLGRSRPLGWAPVCGDLDLGRWSLVDHMVKSEPTLLLRHGRCLEGAMKRERVAADEVLLRSGRVVGASTMKRTRCCSSRMAC